MCVLFWNYPRIYGKGCSGQRPAAYGQLVQAAGAAAAAVVTGLIDINNVWHAKVA